MNKKSLFIFLVLLVSLAFITRVHAADIANIMVRIVYVTPDWLTYEDDAFLQVAKVKESDVLKFYDVAIWEDEKAIELYSIPNTYFADRPGQGGSAEERIAFRKHYTVQKITGMPGKDREKERSLFLKDAMISFVNTLVQQHPGSAHHFEYSGHGGPGGTLFAQMMQPKHVVQFLSHWKEALGRKLGVIDMGGPCNKGGFSDLDAFSPYAEFYIASDLQNGGYTYDEFTSAKYQEVNPDYQYHRLFRQHSSLVEVLQARLDLTRRRYEYSKKDMIAKKVEQANYLYSLEKFSTFSTQFKAHIRNTGQDFYHLNQDLSNFLDEQNRPDLVALFQEIFVHKVDNRDFFEWEDTANGLLMPNKVGGELALDPFYAMRPSAPGGLRVD